METFEQTLRSVVSTLKELQADARNCSGSTDGSLPLSCYTFWIDVLSVHQSLESSIPLLGIRDKAFENLKAVSEMILKPAELSDNSATMIDPVRYGSCVVPFATARHCALSSYLSATWGLYDRLALVCGTLVRPGSFEAFSGEKRMHKLQDGFFGADGKEGVYVRGLSFDRLVEEKWGWPVFCSYKIRNLVLHDGVGMPNDSFFESDGRLKGFLITIDAQDKLISEFCRTKRMTEPSPETRNEMFPSSDLRDILRQNNEQIDRLLGNLLNWGTHALRSQVLAFSGPGMKLITTLKNTSA